MNGTGGSPPPFRKFLDPPLLNTRCFHPRPLFRCHVGSTPSKLPEGAEPSNGGAKNGRPEIGKPTRKKNLRPEYGRPESVGPNLKKNQFRGLSFSGLPNKPISKCIHRFYITIGKNIKQLT